MRLGFTRKLLSTLLFANILMVCVMSLLLFWSIRHGAEGNLQQIEVKALEKISRALIDVYEKEKSWDIFQKDRRRWGVFTQTLPGGALHHLPTQEMFSQVERELRRVRNGPVTPLLGDGRTTRLPPHHKPDSSSLVARLSLLDNEGKLLAGAELAEEDKSVGIVPLMLDGEEIGRLQITPLQWLEDGLESHFQKKQSTAIFYSAIIALAFSLCVSIILGRFILQPIKKLLRGVRKLAEGELEARIEEGAKDEFGDLINNVNNLALQLEETENIRRSMMADVSHELRTPLAVLQAEIEAIQDGIRPCNEAQMSSLHESVTNLSMLVDNLFTLSLSDSGGLTCQRQACNIVETLERTFELYSNLFVKKKIDFKWKTLGGAEARVLADPVRINQVLSNLLNNSYHYTDERGKCEIHIEVKDDTLEIVINDSAPGVSEEDLCNIFDRFYRVDKSRSRSLGGAGLGLALSRSIMEMHGGTIEVDHSPLGGLMTCITMPLLTTSTQ